MQRQRGELVPIGEAFGSLRGPVKAQARFTYLQVSE